MYENANLLWLRNRDLPALIECQACGRRVVKEARELEKANRILNEMASLSYVARNLKCTCGLKASKLMAPRRRVDAELFMHGMEVECIVSETGR